MRAWYLKSPVISLFVQQIVTNHGGDPLGAIVDIRAYRLMIAKTSNLGITGPLWGESSSPDLFDSPFPCHEVIIKSYWLVVCSLSLNRQQYIYICFELIFIRSGGLKLSNIDFTQYINVFSVSALAHCPRGPLLLTWFNFNPSMDK